MSLHRRIGSRQRFLDYLRAYRKRIKSKTPERQRGWEPEREPGVELLADAGKRAPGEPLAAGKHRSLPVLYRELYRSLRGHRRTIAVALLGLSVATLLKLVPPAATKVVIDYVLMARPLPAAEGSPGARLPASARSSPPSSGSCSRPRCRSGVLLLSRFR